MTEEEAKTKWCPHVRASIDGSPNASANKDNSDWDYSKFKCIASDCMMWRYVDYDYIIPGNVPPSSKGALEGYCGLIK